jgi:hypothetical protein
MTSWRNRWRLVAALVVLACLLGFAVSSAVDGGGGTAAGERDGAGDADPVGDPERGLVGGADTDEGEFSLLTYNVAGLPAEMSKLDPGTHLPIVGRLVNSYALVLTQEDFDWWKPGGVGDGLDFTTYHERLVDRSTHQFRSEPHPGIDPVGVAAERLADVQVGDGLGFLSRFPIEGNRRVPWSGCFGEPGGGDGGAGDCMALKGFSFTELTLAEGVTVDVYNVHGEAGDTEADQTLQAADFDELARFIGENSAGRAVIVGGDTNLHTDLVDTLGAGGADAAVWKTFLATTDLTDACVATGCGDPARVDKVAFRSGAGVDLDAVVHAPHPKRFVDGEGEPLSDHVPLEVRFAWERAGS